MMITVLFRARKTPWRTDAFRRTTAETYKEHVTTRERSPLTRVRTPPKGTWLRGAQTPILRTDKLAYQ